MTEFLSILVLKKYHGTGDVKVRRYMLCVNVTLSYRNYVGTYLPTARIFLYIKNMELNQVILYNFTIKVYI